MSICSSSSSSPVHFDDEREDVSRCKTFISRHNHSSSPSSFNLVSLVSVVYYFSFLLSFLSRDEMTKKGKKMG